MTPASRSETSREPGWCSRNWTPSCQTRLAFLEGDAGEALSLAAAAERHASTGAAPTTDLAWYRSYLGILQFDAGRYDQASSHFEAAISADPSLPTAVAGLAQTRAAQGRLNEAIELYIEANNLIVDPGLLAALGDAYQAAGDPDIATAWHDSAEAIARQASQGTIAFNRDLSLFLSDHERDPAEALALAEADLEVRQDLFTYDTYAWALYRNGRFAEARAAADQALALDTPDPHLWYHAGVISAALDEATRAITELERALELSPNFHPLQARHARQLLESLTAVG